MKNKLLLNGKFFINDINIINENISNRKIDSSLEKQVEEMWNAAVIRFKEDIWDSEGYRLNSFEINENKLTIKTAPVNYRIHFAMKTLSSKEEVNIENTDRILVADALIKTSDNKYILSRAEKINEPIQVYLIGGTCTKSRLELKTSSDLFNFIMNRTAEILSIKSSTLSNCFLLGIIQNEIGCVNIVFNIETTSTSVELLKKFQSNNGFTRLIAIDEDKAKDFFVKADNYTECIVNLM